jgi:hypothetical protein
MSNRKSNNSVDDLIKAFRDESVRAIIGELLDERLKSLNDAVEYLTKENDRKDAEIGKLSQDLAMATAKIDAL